MNILANNTTEVFNETVDTKETIKTNILMKTNTRKNIGLIATLSYEYGENKVAMRADKGFDERALNNEFNQILSRISELNFKIQRMSFVELISMSILTNQKHSKPTDEPLTMFSDSKKLYQICRKNILCWQTDLDRFCHEIKTQYSPEMRWVIKTTKDYLKHKMLLEYPYLEDSVGFMLRLNRVLDCKQTYDYGDGLPTSNLDLLTFLIMIGYNGGKCKHSQKNREYFHYLLMELSYRDLELPGIDFVDLLHSAMSEQSDLTYYSASEAIRNACIEHLWEEETEINDVYRIVGYGETEWDWVVDLVCCFIGYEMDWLYPYLKNEDAFVAYVEYLKNEDHE